MESKKLLLLSAIALASMTALVGCGKVDVEEDDETKTQLRIKYTNGGFRSDWLDKLCDEFVEAFAEVSQIGRAHV